MPRMPKMNLSVVGKAFKGLLSSEKGGKTQADALERLLKLGISLKDVTKNGYKSYMALSGPKKLELMVNVALTGQLGYDSVVALLDDDEAPSEVKEAASEALDQIFELSTRLGIAPSDLDRSVPLKLGSKETRSISIDDYMRARDVYDRAIRVLGADWRLAALEEWLHLDPDLKVEVLKRLEAES